MLVFRVYYLYIHTAVVCVCMMCDINDMTCCVLIFTPVHIHTHILENTSVICSICSGQTPGWMSPPPPPPQHDMSNVSRKYIT